MGRGERDPGEKDEDKGDDFRLGRAEKRKKSTVKWGARSGGQGRPREATEKGYTEELGNARNAGLEKGGMILQKSRKERGGHQKKDRQKRLITEGGFGSGGLPLFQRRTVS